MKVYFKYFWEPNSVISKEYFWKTLFKYCDNIVFCNNENDADIIMYSVFCYKNFEINKNKINIFDTQEPLHYDIQYFDISLSHTFNKYIKYNIICPMQMLHTLYNNEIPRTVFLKNRPIRTTIPPKFCCFITKMEKPERMDYFHRLSNYKKVDSLGPCLNNTGIIAPHRDSQEFFKMVTQYKFIITFENSQIENYVTEKIFHGYFSMIIPIYWGSKTITSMFNNDSFIYINEYNEKDITQSINRIIELDNDDDLYLKTVNKPVFADSFDIDSYFDNISKQLSDNIKSLQ